MGLRKNYEEIEQYRYWKLEPAGYKTGNLERTEESRLVGATEKRPSEKCTVTLNPLSKTCTPPEVRIFRSVYEDFHNFSWYLFQE